MVEQTQRQTPDLLQLWRDWLAQTERQFNAFFADAMNADSAARTFGGYIEMHAAFQRMIADTMQRYLSLFNMPSRTDVVGLGETLSLIEDRLARIEDALQLAADAVDARERDYGFEREPARTRQPVGAAFADRGQAGLYTIPEELRR